MAEAAAFSKEVERDLASCGATVAMVFRTGRPRDQMPEGISYTHDPVRVRADLKAHFTPTVVKASPLLRLFGPIADGRLRHDDQDGPIRTATYESISAFMKANGLLEDAYTVTFARPAAAPAA